MIYNYSYGFYVSPYIDVSYIVILIFFSLIIWYKGVYKKRDRRRKFDWLQGLDDLIKNGGLVNTYLSRFAIIFFVIVDMILAPLGWTAYIYAPIELIGYAVIILVKDIVREIINSRKKTPKEVRDS